MELTIQSLGFLIGFQEDIKVPRPHGTINHTVIQSLGFLIGFQEDIIIIFFFFIIIIFILACPDARCESGQTSGSCLKNRPLNRNANKNNKTYVKHCETTKQVYSQIMPKIPTSWQASSTEDSKGWSSFSSSSAEPPARAGSKVLADFRPSRDPQLNFFKWIQPWQLAPIDRDMGPL